MTLDELRAARPVWHQAAAPIAQAEAVERFVQLALRCGYGDTQAEMSISDLREADLSLCVVVGGTWLKSSDPGGAHIFADAAALEYTDRLRRFREAAVSALGWLEKLPRGARSCLVARLQCPKHKLLANLYCLPKDSAPVHDSGGFRLLIAPARRGKIASIGADGIARTRWARAAPAWWYITDDDIWELHCRQRRRFGRRRVWLAGLAQRPPSRAVAPAVFRPTIIALLVMAQVPRFAGLNELSAVGLVAVDGAGCDSWRPLLA